MSADFFGGTRIPGVVSHDRGAAVETSTRYTGMSHGGETRTVRRRVTASTISLQIDLRVHSVIDPMDMQTAADMLVDMVGARGDLTLCGHSEGEHVCTGCQINLAEIDAVLGVMRITAALEFIEASLSSGPSFVSFKNTQIRAI